MSLRDEWREVSRGVQSLIIAGADPKTGTPNLVGWAEEYVNEIGPFVAGIKPNAAFYQGEGGKLHEIWDVYNRMNDIVSYSCIIVLKRLGNKIKLPKKYSEVAVVQLASVFISEMREETKSIAQDAWGLLNAISE